MAGLDGKSAIPACAACFECGRDYRTGSTDAVVRQGLLLGHLSAGDIPGHRVVDKRTTEEETVSLLLFSGKKWLRYGVLGVFIIALVAGIGSFVALLAPYSSYGRIAANLFAPVYRLGNNLLAYFAERADSYAFYETEVWMKSLPTFIIAVITFVVLVILAWRNGRTYCNTICPVGTILGFFSRFSLLRPVLDAEKCKNCSLCSHRCKAACIDYKNHRIDYSRCVACMDCLEICKHDALHLQSRLKTGINIGMAP